MATETTEKKAHRLLTEGRLTVERVGADGTVVAHARGFSDGEVYALGYDPSEGRGQWRCTCPAPRRCSHLIALQLVTVRPNESLSAAPYQRVLDALRSGPKSSREIGCSADFLRGMAAEGLITVDPDAFPDRYVPGNPFIARLPGDDRKWPGWSKWNI